MSDSEELASAAHIPADPEIETCLRKVVRDAVKNEEEVTVNAARTRAEEQLGLDAGFLKDNAQWKWRSKDLISAAFDEPASPEKTKRTAKAAQAKPAPKAGTKRKLDEPQPSRKKAKKDESEDEVVGSAGISSDPSKDGEGESKPNGRLERATKSEDESALSDPPEDADEKSAVKPGNGKSADDDDDDDDESELSSVLDDPPPKKKRQSNAAPKAQPKAKAAKTKKAVEDDESEMSDVLDDPPPKKGRKKKSTSPGATTKAKAKPAASKNLSPDEEEIKRLQSWLLKCGIRKLWHKELASCDTDKQKIKHLKGMLEDVGMTGRYSAEKAKSIKEARELKAELEAAQEFSAQFGADQDEKKKDEDGNDSEDGASGEDVKKAVPGKRARPKGYVDFGDSDEESE